MRYRIQERPNMPGDGDAIIFRSGWHGDYERHKSWHEAWGWLEGNAEPGDTIEVVEAAS